MISQQDNSKENYAIAHKKIMESQKLFKYADNLFENELKKVIDYAYCLIDNIINMDKKGLELESEGLELLKGSCPNYFKCQKLFNQAIASYTVEGNLRSDIKKMLGTTKTKIESSIIADKKGDAVFDEFIKCIHQ